MNCRSIFGNCSAFTGLIVSVSTAFDMMSVVIVNVFMLQVVVGIMEAFENIFRQSFKKGDGSVPNHSPEVSHLHSNALTAWSLLISIAPQYLVDKLIKK